MSLDAAFEETLRRIIREEMQSLGDDRLLTAEQVAEILSYTDVASVRRLAREHKLEVIKLGEKTFRYRNSDIQRLIREPAA